MPPALQENRWRTLYQWLGLTSVTDTHAGPSGPRSLPPLLPRQHEAGTPGPGAENTEPPGPIVLPPPPGGRPSAADRPPPGRTTVLWKGGVMALVVAVGKRLNVDVIGNLFVSQI